MLGPAMPLFLTFLLGIANFILHKAVLDSRHPLMAAMPWFYNLLGGRGSLAVEFAMLLGALLLIAQGSSGWAWFYAAYTAVNALSAWLILTRRV